MSPLRKPTDGNSDRFRVAPTPSKPLSRRFPSIRALRTTSPESSCRRFRPGRILSPTSPKCPRKEKGLPDYQQPLHFHGGDDGIRTHDPYVANVMLSQLSYIPTSYALCARKYFPRSRALCQTFPCRHPQNVHVCRNPTQNGGFRPRCISYVRILTREPFPRGSETQRPVRRLRERTAQTAARHSEKAQPCP